MRDIIESDWKLLREFTPVALDRLCDRILIEVTASCAVGGSRHKRFSDVYSRVEDGNADVAMIFDGMRRSNALQRLGLMRAHRLITNEEFSRFSEGTRRAANIVADSRISIVREAEKE